MLPEPSPNNFQPKNHVATKINEDMEDSNDGEEQKWLNETLYLTALKVCLFYFSFKKKKNSGFTSSKLSSIS